LGEGQLSLTKFLLVTDRPQNLRDFKAVLQYVLERCDFRSDLYVFSNLAMDTLDYTGPKVNEGSKGVLLGVGEPIRALEGKFSGELPAGVTRAVVFCRGCLVLEGKSFAELPKLGSEAAAHPSFAKWPLLVLVDDARKAAQTTMDFLWTTFTRFEPGADLFAAKREIVRNHVSYTGPLLIDARMKPSYPAELECDPKTAKLVDSRWHEYFNGNFG
jgi:3-polyprenyl-4-hydroxybenzoate decarboxylase